MRNLLQRTIIAGAALITASAVPIVPDEMSFQYAYQYPASDLRTYTIESPTSSPKTIKLPDSSFTDDDGNGVISVAVFKDAKENKVFIQIPDATYSKMTSRGGFDFNPTKTQFQSIFDALTKPAEAEASITFDAATGSTVTGTSLTFSHTASASANLIVVPISTGNSGDKVTGVTYNGTALARIDAQGATTDRWAYLYYLANPSTGANNVVVTTSSSLPIRASGITFTGADTTTVVDTSNKAQISGTTLTASITTTADDVALVSSFNSNRDVSSFGSNTTNVFSFGSAGYVQVRSTANVNTGATSLSYNVAFSEPAGAYVIASFNSGAAGGAVTPRVHITPVF